MWIHGEGKIDRTCSSTSRQKAIVSSDRLSTVSCTPHRVEVRPGHVDIAEVRVCRDRRRHVPRHVNLGHHDDSARLGIRDEATQFVIGVAPTVRDAIGAVRIESGLAGCSNRGELAQPRPARHIDPPPLIVGQVQVQPVQSEQRHRVDEALQIIHRQPVPCRIEQDPAPCVCRRRGCSSASSSRIVSYMTQVSRGRPACHSKALGRSRGTSERLTGPASLVW